MVFTKNMTRDTLMVPSYRESKGKHIELAPSAAPHNHYKGCVGVGDGTSGVTVTWAHAATMRRRSVGKSTSLVRHGKIAKPGTFLG